jgi:hypothetical protein
VTTPSTRRRPPGRYDAPSTLGPKLLAVLLTALVLGLVAAGGRLLYSRYGGDAVRGQVRAFTVSSSTAVTISVEVSKAKGSTAYCVLRARGGTGLEVGRDIAVLDAVGTSARSARGTFVLATTERANTAEVAGCRAEPIRKDEVEP